MACRFCAAARRLAARSSFERFVSVLEVLPMVTRALSGMMPLSVIMVMVLVMAPVLPRISIVTGMLPFCPTVMIQGSLGNRATVQPQEESAHLIRISPSVLF